MYIYIYIYVYMQRASLVSERSRVLVLPCVTERVSRQTPSKTLGESSASGATEGNAWDSLSLTP